MKQAGKSGGKNKRQTMIDISEKLGLSGPGREKQDIEYEVDERYDEGGVEEVSKPKFDYKKFFRNRRADGGAMGVESLFEERKILEVVEPIKEEVAMVLVEEQALQLKHHHQWDLETHHQVVEVAEVVAAQPQKLHP